VLVGQAVGAGDGSRARRAAAASLCAGAGFMLIAGLALVALPEPLARLFSAETAVVAVAATLLPIAGVFQVFDGIQVVSIGVLRGVGDTRAPVLLNVLAFWLIGLPASLWFGFGLGGGAAGLWWGLVVGLVVVALALLARVGQQLGRPLARNVVEGTPAPV
jgi:MATE family multidrug resistance protein